MYICPCGHNRIDRHNWIGLCLDCECGREPRIVTIDTIIRNYFAKRRAMKKARGEID